MKKYVEWPDLYESVGAFYEIAVDLSAISQHYYVIFSMGTIVKVLDHNEHFTGYTPEHMETFPLWRIKDSDPDMAREIYNDLVRVWNKQSSVCDCVNTESTANTESTVNVEVSAVNVEVSADCKSTCISSIIKCAYKILLDNPPSEVIPVVCTLDSAKYLVEFCNGLNLVFCDNEEECVDTAISLREYDLMFPQVYAIITPSLELVVCIEE